ncbi:hypothetical protein FisN_1Hh661 [Fistulifera solaris]|uniref:Exocyst complex component Sec6 n=1 Tax=Fistulifera solaris TaxID=1519565 RepID=A0A1Z5KRD1_FISSO|nr:hypothetical protein FisN_1Hh661 [Fistulifera solaris]|eukprot:GAX28551.1 hypothetical protein FisN_1Hh661 [Fistulifera solaris]
MATKTKLTDLQGESFLTHFQKHAFESVRNAYATEHTFYEALDGSVSTSLAEDVFSLIQIQRSVLVEQGNDRVFVEGMLFVLKCVQHEHMERYHQRMYVTLEETCAAANDFLRMSERMENLVEELTSQRGKTENSPFLSLGDDLVHELSRLAVQATERSLVFLLRKIQHNTSIPQTIFSAAWEEELIQNEVVKELMQSIDDYLSTVKRYLSDEILYNKALWMAANACICFYVRSLIQKADACRRRRDKPFISTRRALLRMSDDIAIISEYLESHPELSRRIRPDLDTLHLIRESLGAPDIDALESFIIVLHKRTGSDSLVTRQFVTDLQWLVGQVETGKEAFDHVKSDLQMVTDRVQEQQSQTTMCKNTSQLVRLDDMLRALYEDRLVQGLLPVCWLCLPTPAEVTGEPDEQKLARRFRQITRSVAQLGFRTQSSARTEEQTPLT